MPWEFHSVAKPRPSFPRKRESSASFWIPGLRSTQPGMTDRGRGGGDSVVVTLTLSEGTVGTHRLNRDYIPLATKNAPFRPRIFSSIAAL